MKHRIGDKGKPVANKRGAGIFFTDGTHVLLLKNASGSHKDTWSLPGGGAKKGESDIGTAMRETKEETGLESIPGYRFDSLASQDGHKRFVTFMFRVGKQFEVDLSSEHTEWEWVAFDDLTSKPLHPKFEANLQRYLKATHRKVRNFTEWAQIRGLFT